jgi:ferredoxin
MADKSDKVPENVEGSFFVDSSCIDCDHCRAVAPNNFERSDQNGYSFVSKQPENDEEYQFCLDALEGCPVESIGEDGDC